MGWRYIASRLNGDGTETFLSWDVPLHDTELHEDLSGPGGISGYLSPAAARLLGADGKPLFETWSTAIYAEKDGHLRAGGILVDLDEAGPKLTMECVGFTGYLQGQPYRGELSRIGLDPLDVARHLWATQQGIRGGNLGITVDGTTSPARVGLPEGPVEWQQPGIDEPMWNYLMSVGWTGDPADSKEQLHPPEGAALGPYTLGWWATHDMGQEFDKLAAETPFDYQVVHSWDGDTIAHHLRLGYPALGTRRADLRFAVGENVSVVPKVEYSGNEYASEVIVLGAGEGRKMIHSPASRETGRLHRATVVADKQLTSQASALKAAEAELKARLGDADISELVVREHPHAPLGSFGIGDEILVHTRPGWSEGMDLWVRILAVTTHPSRDECTLAVARVEKVT